MSFLDYRSTRPWAKAMRQSVLTRKMPPWFAEPGIGHWANDRSLTEAEVQTIVSWADGGAPEGSAKDAPKPRTFVEGWNIGTPDMVFEMPSAYEVPAKGTIEYTYYVLPTGFSEDRWVQMAEIRPGNRRVVHHVIAFVRPPGSKWLKDARPGEAFVPRASNGQRESSFGGEWLTGYAPGTVPDQLKPGQARLIKAGSDIVLQMHYTANGTAQSDRSRIGIVFAKEPPKQRVVTLASSTNKFTIPAGAANHQVDSSITLHSDSTLVALLPHMHLRGKSFEYRAVFPTGETKTILRVPRYDFNWQLSYFPVEPIPLPKGTKIDCTAHYDNSANNPANPDPTAEVRYGDQSWEEMMIGFFDVAIDVKADPASLMRPPRRAARSEE